MKQLFKKHSRLIFIVLAIVIVVILCAIFKYSVMIPLILLFVLSVSIMISRKILRKKKKKATQEVAQCALTTNETNKLTQYFVSRDEKYISSLGNGYIMNYLASGNLSKGFSVISNKRVYFRGSCFSGQGKSLVKTNEERTVDIKDITGSGFIYRRYIGVLLGLFIALITLLGSIAGSTVALSTAWKDTQRYQRDAEDLQNQIDNIDKSEQLVNDLSNQVVENQASLEKLQQELSDLKTLQLQKILEISKESLSISDFLYDTEINKAFEDYLQEMATVFEKSELYGLLWDVHDAVRYPSGGSHSYYMEKKAKEALEHFDDSYYYAIDGNILVNYTNKENCRIDLITFCTDIVGIPYDILQFAYALSDEYETYGRGESRSDFFERCSFNGDYYIDEGQRIDSRLTAEDIELSQEAYRNFLEKVAVTDLDSGQSLPEICLNYIITHPDASFANYVNLSGITTEYDSQINELNTKIMNSNDSISASETEIAKLQELQNSRSKYEQQYNNAQRKASSSFSIVSITAVAAGLLIPFLVSCFLIFFDYLRKRKTLFRIEYAGGCIAFDVSFYAKAEIDDFQKQLRRAKDLAEESAAKPPAKESPVQPTAATQNSVPDDLRKYADLLKEGLISQEEYDAMKKKILGL